MKLQWPPWAVWRLAITRSVLASLASSVFLHTGYRDGTDAFCIVALACTLDQVIGRGFR